MKNLCSCRYAQCLPIALGLPEFTVIGCLLKMWYRRLPGEWWWTKHAFMLLCFLLQVSREGRRTSCLCLWKRTHIPYLRARYEKSLHWVDVLWWQGRSNLGASVCTCWPENMGITACLSSFLSQSCLRPKIAHIEMTHTHHILYTHPTFINYNSDCFQVSSVWGRLVCSSVSVEFHNQICLSVQVWVSESPSEAQQRHFHHTGILLKMCYDVVKYEDMLTGSAFQRTKSCRLSARLPKTKTRFFFFNL